MEINLISDTVTKPTKGMLEAMMQAKVGDDVFKSDPTVNALQEKVATLFGMEDALFFPSGTMANQVAIKLHTHSGEQLICDKWAHVYNFEGGGVAANSGVSSILIDGERGMFKVSQLEGFVNDPNNIHLPTTTLVCIENTTNKGGGACWDFEELKKIKQFCTKNELSYHLDGARLFNALVAKKETPKQYGELFDTISICFSKGLGAPVGSILLGTKVSIKKALRIRKMFGGAMRQVGFLAAAAIYALDNHIDRLAEDHAKAKKIGEVLATCSYVKKVEHIETNIVIFNLNDTLNDTDFINQLKEKNILIVSMGNRKLRMVTHLNFTNQMLEKLIFELKAI